MTVSPPAPDGPRATHEAAATVWAEQIKAAIVEPLPKVQVVWGALAALDLLVAAAERTQKLEAELEETQRLADSAFARAEAYLALAQIYDPRFPEIQPCSHPDCVICAALASVVRDG